MRKRLPEVQSSHALARRPQSNREPGLALIVGWLVLTGGLATYVAADCASTTTHCVDDTVGSTQEFVTIQAAVDVAMAGDTVLVHDGSYAGFRVSTSGTSSDPLVVRASGDNVLIASPEPFGSGESIRIQNSSYVTVEGFKVDRTGLPGFGLTARGATSDSPMSGVVVRGNTVFGSGSVNIYVSQIADSLVENNVAYGSQSSHGFYVANAGCDNTTVRGNASYDNAVAGIHFNGDASIGGDGLQTGLVIDGNTIYNNGQNGLNMDGVQDSVVQNNLVYDNTRHALRMYQIDGSQGPWNMRFINNTFVVPASGSWAIKLSEDLGEHTLFNNILLSDNANAGAVSVGNLNFTSRNNAVVDRFSLDDDQTLIDLSAWQVAGHGTESFVSDAASLFIDPGNQEFQLGPGAAAVDTGIASIASVTAPTLDIVLTLRPQADDWDLGAYEQPTSGLLFEDNFETGDLGRWSP
ncbi:MAG: right-handed parallel beta-helix repeat-containing protein [Thermoanaerobaculia bacterium]|nr:right-handed parallel beta-helix repeat-containing protein [Thermoanaerobaculia bacterium]